MAKTIMQTDIAGLRALSVLLVVLYHFNLTILGGGFVGVDLFFVISGFLMTRIIHTGMTARQFHYGDFLLKRALRIFPALFVTVLVLLVAGAVLLPPPDLHSLAEQCLRALTFSSNTWYAGQQGYFSDGLDDRWLLHTWSLSVEWQFYMLYPAMIWLGLRATRLLGQRHAFHAVLLAFFFGSLALCVWMTPQEAFFSVATRSWQMIAGGLVFLWRDHRWLRALQGAALSYAALAVIVGGVAIVHHFDLEQQWPGFYAMLPVAGACMLLAARYEHNILLSNRPMQTLGAWSYSIYLWHWPVVIALTITGVMADAPKLAKLVGIPASLLLGYLSYRYIEPVRAWRKASAKRVTAGLLAGGATLAATAAVFVVSGGLALRTNTPELYQTIASTGSAATYPPECENTGADISRQCTLNTGASGQKVLVLGDSHAGHLYAWFQQHGKTNTTFYVKSGCPVIPGFERLGQDNHCREFSDAAYRLAGSGAYDLVIVSQNWTFFSPNASGICSFERERCVTPKASLTPGLPVERVQGALRGLLDKNIAVVVVDGTPHFNFSVPKRLARALYWHGEVTTTAQSPQLANNAAYDQLFARLAEHRRFSVVSLRKQLCSGEQCTIYDKENQIPVFVDKSHLNPAWIASHGQQFEQLLQLNAERPEVAANVSRSSL